MPNTVKSINSDFILQDEKVSLRTIFPFTSAYKAANSYLTIIFQAAIFVSLLFTSQSISHNHTFKAVDYLWLHWVFIAAQGFSLVVESRGYSLVVVHRLFTVAASHCRAQALRHMGSAVVAHRSICSSACGIFSDQGSSLCPLRRQVDSQPLDH